MSEVELDGRIATRFLEVVAETLAIDVVDPSRTFQDLDGDSLSAIIVVETLREEGIVASAEALLSSEPLERVAARLEASHPGPR
ncbi:acyl carrier protein [Amycolatopsis sp. NPDC051061]|uniref:acyl carrier protein n=1 Tax=Amycolatopsis sp. NPDC051061 TaxID=3155042 RepID=UPI00342F7EA0